MNRILSSVQVKFGLYHALAQKTSHCRQGHCAPQCGRDGSGGGDSRRSKPALAGAAMSTANSPTRRLRRGPP